MHILMYRVVSKPMTFFWYRFLASFPPLLSHHQNKNKIKFYNTLLHEELEKNKLYIVKSIKLNSIEFNQLDCRLIHIHNIVK